MRRLLLVASAIGALTVGAGAAQADWHHDHHVDRCYYPPVRYVRTNVAYYPPVYAAPPIYAAPPVVVAPPAGFVSLRGRNFGFQFGF